MTDYAIEFIRRKAGEGEPFFAYVPYTRRLTSLWTRTRISKAAQAMAASLMCWLRLTPTLARSSTQSKNSELTANTIVIFTADNGREGIKRSFGFTGPWRGTMFAPYEGSLRVPFLIRYPDKIPAGRVSNEIVHLVDLVSDLRELSRGAKFLTTGSWMVRTRPTFLWANQKSRRAKT